MTQPASAQIAPISRRAVAFLIDAFIAAGLAFVLLGGLVVAVSLGGSAALPTTLLIGGAVVALALTGWFVIYTAMQAGRGSIGMRAQGIRLIAAAHDAPLGFGRALVRNVVFGLASAIVVGYFTPLFDGSGRFQGWHDKAAGSLMLDASAKGGTAPDPAAAATQAASETVAASAARPAARADAPRGAGPSLLGVPQSAAPSRPAAVAPAAAPMPAAEPAPADEGALIAFVPGFTPAGQAPRTPTAAQADAEAPLDATVQGRSPARAEAPVAEAAVLPAAVAAQSTEELDDTRISIPGHRLVFTWDDGTRVSVSRRTIFGRNPAPEDGAVVVPVRDETLSLSKTHFEAAAESSGGWVLDRNSTNGMTLVRDGHRIACPPGQRVPVRLGDAIEIGDRIVTVGGYA